MTLDIQYETDKQLPIDYEPLIIQVVNSALDYVDCPYEVELNVTLTDNEEIHKINREFREIDRPTDVLSFPMLEYEKPGDFKWLEENEDQLDDCFNPETGELLLGDIVISVEKVLEQAKEYGHSNERELGFLIAHSMLHLFGYDHMEEQERVVMEKKQEDILQKDTYVIIKTRNVKLQQIKHPKKYSLCLFAKMEVTLLPARCNILHALSITN